MKKKFKASYDEEGDVLTIYETKGKVKESVEVSEDLVIDIDKHKQLVNLELMDAYKFLHTLNVKISRKVLSCLQEVSLEVKNYRNYTFITLLFKHEDMIIEEKLPAFARQDFKSPLLASASA